MTSRERVLKSLEFSLDGKVPRQIWVLPWAENHYPEDVKQIRKDFPDDIEGAPLLYSNEPRITGDPYLPGSYSDEWGCEFVNIHEGVIGEVKNPIIRTLEDAEKLSLPENLLSLRQEEVNNYCRSRDTFILQGTCARPFERIQFLRGTENIYLDIGEKSDLLKVLLNKVHQFYLKEMEVWADTDVDGLFFIDDWGSQQSLLISPETWRELFKPLYREYTELAHSRGKKVFMHSDGFILDIIPDLIEIGVDALNSQVFCMGIDPLGKYRGEICFWGEIDRQNMLPLGSPETVFQAVQELYDKLYSRGGIIAQCEFGPGAKPENIRTVFQAWNSVVSA